MQYHLTKKGLVLLLLAVILFVMRSVAQKPDFSLVGFGTGTTGGNGGTTVNVSNYDQLAAAVVGVDKKIIKVSGTITGPGGGVILDIGSNKSIIGVGNNATLSMIQLHLKNSQQIIIQNIKMTMIGSTLGSDADMICLETTSAFEVKYVWIDHCEFYNITPTLPETAAKKDLYDGMIDVKKSSSLITISWNYFHDHWKCSLIGFTDTDVYDRKITYHHNYFKNIKSRAPSYRGGTGHIYNNYFDGLNDPNSPTSEGVHTREKACLLVEGNYFENYSKTIYNAIADCTFEGFAYGSDNTGINAPAQTATLCSSFKPSYTYKLDPSVNVPGIVASWSGVGKLDAVAVKLTTSITGSGTVSLEPAGGNYPAGTIVTATATPASGSVFNSWGGSASGTAANTTITMDASKSLTAKFSVSTVTGLDITETSSFNFDMYPSPVNTKVQLDIDLPEAEKTIIEIRDYTGRTVVTEPSFMQRGPNTVHLDISHLPAGMYFCTLVQKHTSTTRKLIKD